MKLTEKCWCLAAISNHESLKEKIHTAIAAAGAGATFALNYVNGIVSALVGLITLVFISQKVYYRWRYERRLAEHCQKCEFRLMNKPDDV